MGVEPMNTGFADQRVSHFATGASCCHLSCQFDGPNPRRGVDPSSIPQYLLRLRRCADIWFHRLVAGKELIRFFVRHRARDDDVIARLPVRWSRYLVFRRELNGIERA